MTDKEFDEVFMLATKMYDFVMNAHKMRYNSRIQSEEFKKLQSENFKLQLENKKLKGEIL